MAAAAIWKSLVVLYTKAKPMASKEYRIPVINPLTRNWPIIIQFAKIGILFLLLANQI